ncbi:putative metallopeptidase [Treponema sp.]|uniref:putative metallopeptidase n=1 Tax=Treponema sp. TaxID=166 RepID=UPI00388E63C8
MFEEAADLQDLAQICFDKFADVREAADAVIAFIWSEKPKMSKGKVVFADTTKVEERVRFLSRIDFIITFYRPACADLTGDQMEILMHHELMHVGFNSEDGKTKIIPHDIEDFRAILEAHGMDWVH